MNILFLGTAVLLAAFVFGPEGSGIWLTGFAVIFYGYCLGYQGGKDRALRDNRNEQ